MNTNLSFHEIKFTPVVHNNQVWLTSKELAFALNYSSTKSVTDIYNNNSDEFTNGMSLVVDSTTNGVNGSSRRIKVRIFSLRGAHLIAMFARTPVAKEFRRWVLDILDREVGTPTNPLQSPVRYDSRTLCYKRAGVTINELPLKDSDLIINLESWLQLAQKNGWVVIRREELASKMVGMIEQCLLTH